MPAISSSPDPKVQAEIDRKRGRIVPWVIAAFYLAFVAAFMVFVFIAYGHPPHTVTQNAYEKGLAYNDTLSKAEAQAQLGWTSRIEVADKRIQFWLNDASGATIENAQVRAWFVHPSDSTMDRSFNLSANEDGLWSAAIDLPAHGLWTVRVTAVAGDHEYQSAARIEAR